MNSNEVHKYYFISPMYVLFIWLECDYYSREETIQGRKLLIIRRFLLRKLFKGGKYSREETICGNTVSFICTLVVIAVSMHQGYTLWDFKVVGSGKKEGFKLYWKFKAYFRSLHMNKKRTLNCLENLGSMLYQFVSSKNHA